MEERLYELARKDLGEQPEWLIDEDNLLKKTSSKANIREFSPMIIVIIVDDSIPDFQMTNYKFAKGIKQVRF